MTKRPTIVIGTYGGHRFGMGHLIRDMELAAFLEDVADVVFAVRGSEPAVAMVEDAGFSSVSAQSLRSVAKAAAPDLIIYDRPYPLGPIEDFGDIPARVIGLDYFYYDDPRIAVAINIMSHYKTGAAAFGKLFEGTEYAIIRREIIKNLAMRGGIAREVKKVLITFGGGDPRNNTQRVLTLLSKIAEPRLEVRVVCGHVFRNGLNYRGAGVHRYEVSDTVPDIGKLMVEADLAFCGGGTTLMELLSLGVPSISRPQSPEELAFADSLAEKGALLMWGGDDGLLQQKLNELIRDDGLRHDRSGRGRELFDGGGAVRIKNIAMAEIAAGDRV